MDFRPYVHSMCVTLCASTVKRNPKCSWPIAALKDSNKIIILSVCGLVGWQAAEGTTVVEISTFGASLPNKSQKTRVSILLLCPPIYKSMSNRKGWILLVTSRYYSNSSAVGDEMRNPCVWRCLWVFSFPSWRPFPTCVYWCSGGLFKLLIRKIILPNKCDTLSRWLIINWVNQFPCRLWLISTCWRYASY